MEPLTNKRSRQDDDTVGSSEVVNKTPCKYGSECYRKNPEHFEKFSHPGDSKNTLDSSQGDIPPKKLLKTEVSYAESIDCAKSPCPPFYLTKVAGIADMHNTPDVAIGIKDILSPNMGDLESSAQVCNESFLLCLALLLIV